MSVINLWRSILVCVTHGYDRLSYPFNKMHFTFKEDDRVIIYLWPSESLLQDKHVASKVKLTSEPLKFMIVTRYILTNTEAVCVSMKARKPSFLMAFHFFSV